MGHTTNTGTGETETNVTPDGSSEAKPQVDRAAPSPLVRVHYVKTEQLETWIRSSSMNIMAVIHYDQASPEFVPIHYPAFSIALPQLSEPTWAEVWTSASPVEYRRIQDMRIAATKQMIFGQLQIEESSDSLLSDVAYEAYCRVATQAQRVGYPHLLRVWNYFPRMNAVTAGLERYQQFCVGRHQAMVEHVAGFPHALPAGTAVGTRSGPLQLYFLAATVPGIPIENPRQMSAYHYPREYGPCSPSFARATLHQTEFGSQLFIAGTASVVGHATQHAGAPTEQAVETIKNIKALMEQVETKYGTGMGWGSAVYKLYLRHAEHLHHVHEICRAQLSGDGPLLCVQGDLCRRDLLLEIEAVLTLN